MNFRSFFSAAKILSLGCVLLLLPLRAVPITFTGTNTNNLGNTISASAVFDTPSSGLLRLTLTNTMADPFHIGGADVLTGLYFTLNSGVTLTTSAAYLSSGSTMMPFTSSTAGIASNWGYFTNPGLVNGAAAGSRAVAATGLVSGRNYDFNGVYHNSSGYLSAPAYGIVGNANDEFYGQGFVPLIANGLVFEFAYTGNITSITNVAFVYGTSAGEGSITGQQTPPPSPVPDDGATVALLGAALIGFAWVQRKRC